MAVTTTVNCSVHNTTNDIILFTAPVRLVGQGLETETFGFQKLEKLQSTVMRGHSL